jgi:hypothetical protein
VNPRKALGRGGFASAACVACCAPPIIAALGVTAGLAATVGVFLGLAAAIAVVLVGGAWIVTRVRRSSSCADDDGSATEAVAVAAPVRRYRL